MTVQVTQARRTARTPQAGGAERAARTSRATEPSHSVHWLGYAALCGWLTGPLLATGYWLASGDADDGQLTFSAASGLLPLAGLLLVWAAFVRVTHGTPATGWRVAARRATAVLALGSVGWLLAYALPLPTGTSINALALEWAALTLPYPAAAAAVRAAPRWTTRARSARPVAPRTVPHPRLPLPASAQAPDSAV